MNLHEIFRWVIFSLLIVHFLISATMWIINDNGKNTNMYKTDFSLKGICNLLKNNSKVYLLSVIIFGISILFISLVMFEKPVKEGLEMTTSPPMIEDESNYMTTVDESNYMTTEDSDYMTTEDSDYMTTEEVETRSAAQIFKDSLTDFGTGLKIAFRRNN